MRFEDLYNKSVIKNIVSWNVATEPTDDSYKAEETVKLDYLESIKSFLKENPEHIVSQHYKNKLFSDLLEKETIEVEQALWKKYLLLKSTKSNADDEYFDLLDNMISVVKKKLGEKSLSSHELTFFNDRQLGKPEFILTLVGEMAKISKEFLSLKPSNNILKEKIFTMDILTQYMNDFEDIDYKISNKNGSFMTPLDRNNSRIHISKNKKDIIDTASSITHEVGHALYQNRILNKNTTVGVLGDFISLSLHESSSIIHEIALSGFDYTVTERKENLFRIGSDKVHYIIHIYIRMKIEEMLFSNKITAREIPFHWNKLMLEYTGMIPENDWEGFLQDVHWNSGAFGYFHSYAVGFFNAVSMYVNIQDKLTGELTSDTLNIILPTIDNWYGSYNESSENILSDMHPNINNSFSVYKNFIFQNFNYVEKSL